MIITIKIIISRITGYNFKADFTPFLNVLSLYKGIKQVD